MGVDDLLASFCVGVGYILESLRLVLDNLLDYYMGRHCLELEHIRVGMGLILGDCKMVLGRILVDMGPILGGCMVDHINCLGCICMVLVNFLEYC